MVTMYFNPGSSHMLVGIASQQDQEVLFGMKQYAPGSTQNIGGNAPFDATALVLAACAQ